MKWLSRWFLRLLRYVPADERQGIRLLPGAHWELASPGLAGLPGLLRALPETMPPGSVLFLEGSPAAEIRAYLDHRPAPITTAVARAVIWPRQSVFHLALTRENLEGLAACAARYRASGVACHLHVYQEDRLLLEWYDLPLTSLRLSRELPAGVVKHLATRLGLRCTITRS